MLQAKAKSLFASRTFWGAIFTCVVGATPVVAESCKNHKLTIDDVAKLVLIVAGTGATIAARVNATAEVYTPPYLPGPNQSDYEANVGEVSSPPASLEGNVGK